MNSNETVKVGPFGAYEMSAKVNKFQAKGWLYLNFEKGGRACIDLATRALVKGQCHAMPVIPQAEIDRLVAKYTN